MTGSLASFRRRLHAWYAVQRRELPWRSPRSDRTARIDPYHVLVSEFMLQQTQVTVVIPYFQRFIERFPNLQTLAAADTTDILRLWQGLGYYSRARNLQRAAQLAVSEFDGLVPSNPEDLGKLPGVGRYTAGAIASIAFGQRVPILDGNVTRVLCRLDKVMADPRQRAVLEILWTRAEEILPRKNAGDFNSALMELGATVCTPRAPKCLICPVRAHCEACAAGVQEQTPLAKTAVAIPLLQRRVFCIESETRWLIEQRPATGRWAGLWQFITLERDDSQTAMRQLRSLRIAVEPPLRQLGVVKHGLTHRRYEFEAFACTTASPMTGVGDHTRRWVTLGELDALPLSKPQLQIAKLL